jgi:hypothetical protein
VDICAPVISAIRDFCFLDATAMFIQILGQAWPEGFMSGIGLAARACGIGIGEIRPQPLIRQTVLVEENRTIRA